ncbi:MAG: CDP-diacylglycerol--serine O-phosphatidyltransferase [Acidobacteriota bacterium]
MIRKRIRRKRTKLRKRIEGLHLIPAVLTIANLFFGFLAIKNVISEKFKIAALMIIISWILDILDGRIARITKSASHFGIQIDSLADAISFGIAPSLLIYYWALKNFYHIGWVFGFIYLMAGVLRLARFNITAVPGEEKKYFIGLPIPAAAVSIAGFVLYNNKVVEDKLILILLTIYILFISLLMISNLKYTSYEKLNFKITKNFWIFLVLAMFFGVFYFYSQISVLLIIVPYIFYAPFLLLRKKMLTLIKKREREVLDAQ